MQHFDEGILHAYLDGELTPVERQRVDEHLAACEVCRARLAEERALIKRAGDLLGALEPPVRSEPGFDELRRRAGARPRHGRRPVAVPLAWAATIVLALGVGWYAREVMFPVEQGPAQLPADQDRLALTQESPPAPASTGTVEPRTGGGRGYGPPPNTTQAAREEPAAGLEQRRALEEPPPPAPRAAAPQPVAADAPREPVADRLFFADSAGWRETTLEDASERVGAPLAVVPGLPVEKVEVNTSSEARVTQRLSTEWVIQLSQRRQSVERAARTDEVARARNAAPQAQAEGRVAAQVAAPVLVRTMGALQVAISSPAPIPADSLARLLGRARQD